MTLQMALDSAFYEMKSGHAIPVKVFMQEFPYPPYVIDAGVNEIFMDILPIMTIFTFVFLCPAVLKRVVEEKTTGIKVSSPFYFLLDLFPVFCTMQWLTFFVRKAFQRHFEGSPVCPAIVMLFAWDKSDPILKQGRKNEMNLG